MEAYHDLAASYDRLTNDVDYEATVEARVPFIWCTYGFGVPEGYESKVDSFEELLNL